MPIESNAGNEQTSVGKKQIKGVTKIGNLPRVTSKMKGLQDRCKTKAKQQSKTKGKAKP